MAKRKYTYWYGYMNKGIFGKAKNGSEQVQVEMNLADKVLGIKDGKEETEGVSGLKRSIYLSFTGKAKKITENKLVELGCGMNFDDDELTFISETWATEFRLRSYESVHQGKTTEKFEFDFEGAEIEPASEDTVQTYMARYASKANPNAVKQSDASGEVKDEAPAPDPEPTPDVVPDAEPEAEAPPAKPKRTRGKAANAAPKPENDPRIQALTNGDDTYDLLNELKTDMTDADFDGATMHQLAFKKVATEAELEPADWVSIAIAVLSGLPY
jgi:hypothetical protein